MGDFREEGDRLGRRLGRSGRAGHFQPLEALGGRRGAGLGVDRDGPAGILLLVGFRVPAQDNGQGVRKDGCCKNVSDASLEVFEVVGREGSQAMSCGEIHVLYVQLSTKVRMTHTIVRPGFGPIFEVSDETYQELLGKATATEQQL